MGVLSGVSDIIILTERIAFIELKTTSKPSKNQLKFLEEMDNLGHFASICYSLPDFKAAVKDFLDA